MARVGTNPMQWITEIHKPEKVTITTVVHIPYLSGYWEKSLEVLKICINSISESMISPFDLIVFDNDSCSEVQDYLAENKRKGKIQYLILSDKNLGKLGAWNILFSVAQGEIIIYTDSDVLFSKGWFEQSMNVLKAFPKVGMITAQPARGHPNFHEVNSSTLAESKNDPSVIIRKGKLIPDKLLEKVRIGLGYSEEFYKANKLDSHSDIALSKGNETAYVSASHFQFLSKKSILDQVTPFKVDRTYGGDEELDVKINDLGYWRLSTRDYLVHHMGNSPSFGQQTPITKNEKPESRSTRFLRFLLRVTTIKMIVKRINLITFKLLSTRR